MGGAFRTIVDYGPKTSRDWTTIQQEGAYEIEVSALNTMTGDTAVTTATFLFTPIVTGAGPLVTQTANPLVYIYSAPSCESGSRIRVEFQSSDGVAQSTPFQACRPKHTNNFYVAGLRADTQYSAHHTI